MQTRRLGNTDVYLSVLGIGTWAIGGGDWKYGWGPQDDKESIKAIHAAHDLGFNWIDTAAAYGLGHSEQVVGQAIKGRTRKPFIATKCGLKQDKKGEIYSEITEASIREEVEASLRRLGVERIDLYQIHWPNPKKDIDEAFQTLLALKEEGKILHAGVSNFSLDQLKQISKYGLPATLQSPLSLIRQELGYEILPWCQESNVSVLAYSPMQAGLLTGKASRGWIASLDEKDWRKQNKYFTEPVVTSCLNAIEKLSGELKRTYASPENLLISASLQWVLAQPAVTSAIVGVRSPEQANQLATALTTQIAETDLKKAQALFEQELRT